jgi:hypothetical protein
MFLVRSGCRRSILIVERCVPTCCIAAQDQEFQRRALLHFGGAKTCRVPLPPVAETVEGSDRPRRVFLKVRRKARTSLMRETTSSKNQDIQTSNNAGRSHGLSARCLPPCARLARPRRASRSSIFPESRTEKIGRTRKDANPWGPERIDHRKVARQASADPPGLGSALGTTAQWSRAQSGQTGPTNSLSNQRPELAVDGVDAVERGCGSLSLSARTDSHSVVPVPFFCPDQGIFWANFPNNQPSTGPQPKRGQCDGHDLRAQQVTCSPPSSRLCIWRFVLSLTSNRDYTCAVKQKERYHEGCCPSRVSVLSGQGSE